ncbi:MAG: VWA domain-containing protein, partial [bacterium]|nr:VWA domain-containing protein [bacterium]
MKPTKPFIILILLPVIILLAGYGIVKLLNGTVTGRGRFNITLDRDVLFPWQRCAVAGFNLDIAGEQYSAQNTEPVDIVLVLDSSMSMDSKVEDRTRAAIVREVSLDFIDNFESMKNVRIGGILFNEGVAREMPLNRESGPLRDVILGLEPSGDTDFSPPLELAAAWFKDSNATKKYLVFLTDGEPGTNAHRDRPNRIYLESLAPNHVDVYMVGVGDRVPFSVLRDVIKNEKGDVEPGRILTCHDPVKLQILFDHVGEKIGNVAGRQGRLTVPMADDAFSPIQPPPHGIRKKYPRSRPIR